MPGPGEPLWTGEDRDKALAFELTQREACPSCGMRSEDFYDEKGHPHDPPLYEPVVKRCEGCAIRATRRYHLERDVKAECGGQDASPEAMRALSIQERISASLAGMFVTVLPFDPFRDIKGGE